MLIGRDDDLARLRDACASGAGAPSAVFLDGAIGVGKTALLLRFLAEADRGRVLFARSPESRSHVPLLAVRSIVEELLDDDLQPLLAEGASMRSFRRRVREALSSPAYVVVDDVQWLDPDSRELLADLLSQPLASDITFVFVHRASHAPRVLARAAARGGLPVAHVTVGPLLAADARDLLALHGSTDPELLRLAEGNPLFLRLLAEGSRVGFDPSDPTSAAPGIKSLDDTLVAEIRTLGDEPRALLHALSLEPAPAPAALGGITGLSAERIAAAAEALAGRGLTDPLELTVLHPLIRAAAYHDMPVAERVAMHRAAADLAPTPIERAAHLRHLGAHVTLDELDALVEAAGSLAATAPRSARRMLERTRRIPHRERDLLLARALLLDGRPRQAEEPLRALAASGDESKQAAALLVQSLRIQGRPDEAVDLVREITDWERHPEIAVEAATLMVMHESDQDAALIERAAAPSTRPGVSAALAALAALAHLRHGNVAEARAPYERARDGFATLPGSELLPVIDAATAAGWSAHMVGDFTGGAAFVERAIGLAERNGHFHALPHLYSILAFLCIPLDRGDQARECVEKALDAARQYGWPEVVPLATTAALVAAPSKQETVRWHRKLAALEPPRTWWWRQVSDLFRARVEIRLGLPADVAALERRDGTVFDIQKHVGLGELALRRGDTAAAAAQARSARALSDRFATPYLTAQSAQFEAELLRAAGRPAEARAAAEEAIAGFAEAGATLYVRAMGAWASRMLPDDGEAGIDAGGEPLTARERDVAELAADGRTNREIAAMLHLSVRTVESHVARILRKRRLRSRAGLARSLGRG